MRNPAGFGSVRKLSGNRRKPYQALVTVGWEDGRQKQKTIGTFPSRKEAMQALAEYNNDPSVFDTSAMTFADLYNEYTKTLIARSESTQKQKQAFFRSSEILHGRQLSSISSDELQLLVSSKTASATQQQYISFYRDMFRYAMSQGFAQKNPAEYLLKTAHKKDNDINPFTYPEILLMPEEYNLFFYTGLRADEMLSLRKENIIDNGNVIAVPGTKTNNAFRYVPVSGKIAPLMREKSDRIWTLHRSYQKLYNDVKSLTGNNHTTHDMRKTFATALAMKDVPERIIKKLLGHATTDVTENHYIKRDFSELKEAVNAIDLRVLL